MIYLKFFFALKENISSKRGSMLLHFYYFVKLDYQIYIFTGLSHAYCTLQNWPKNPLLVHFYFHMQIIDKKKDFSMNRNKCYLPIVMDLSAFHSWSK